MKHWMISLKIFIALTILTGVIYPLMITLIAQLTMPSQANGSLFYKDQHLIGSTLIAQKFTSDRYFWPRPSAIDYQATLSGGSNLGPTSKKLKERVEKSVKEMGEHVPSELVYTSGSGLDPHISLTTALFQIERIAKARSLPEETLRQFVIDFSNPWQQRLFGMDYLNVLLLNNALDNNLGDSGVR